MATFSERTWLKPDETLVPITNHQELETIQNALELKDALKPVRVHISTAAKLFADRKAPDYGNSIKESVSAVEAVCSIIVGSSATLGQALKGSFRNTRETEHP